MQLRAGASLIDLVPADPNGALDGAARNMDHFACGPRAFDAAALGAICAGTASIPARCTSAMAPKAMDRLSTSAIPTATPSNSKAGNPRAIAVSGEGRRFFPGFEQRRIATSGAEINLVTGGNGPPLLLLHGYPQTHLMWRKLAPRFAGAFTVVIPDLRGYGDSSKPPAGSDSANYAKRALASDQVETMAALGFERFFVVGSRPRPGFPHRLARDHAERVERVALLNIVPTLYRFETIDQKAATWVWHWFFLIQPGGLPERLIEAEFFLRHLPEACA